MAVPFHYTRVICHTVAFVRLGRCQSLGVTFTRVRLTLHITPFATVCLVFTFLWLRSHTTLPCSRLRYAVALRTFDAHLPVC